MSNTNDVIRPVNVTNSRPSNAEILGMMLEVGTREEGLKWAFPSGIPEKLPSDASPLQRACWKLSSHGSVDAAERLRMHAHKEQALFAFYGASAENRAIVDGWIETTKWMSPSIDKATGQPKYPYTRIMVGN